MVLLVRIEFLIETLIELSLGEGRALLILLDSLKADLVVGLIALL